jgi:hypothetical protein
MVWIYGGGFFGGAGSEARYGGDGLAKRGAVVITFNYRLGSLGFFAHPALSAESERKISGNYGMQDALAALQWVQRNIAVFGGDPSNVTVFGESAGANMTAALVGSPQAKGLFHRAIAQSGGWMGLGMARMGTLARAEEVGAKALTDAGLASIADLRAKPAQEVFTSIRGGNLVVDGHFIPEDLSLTFANGRQNAVDLLIGSNKDEGTFFQRQGLAAEQFKGKRGSASTCWPTNFINVPSRRRRASDSATSRRSATRRGQCGSSPSASEARQQRVRLLLHARTAGAARPPVARRDARRRNSVHVRQPRAARAMDRRRPAARGYHVLVLGQLRAQRRSERFGLAALAGLSRRRDGPSAGARRYDHDRATGRALAGHAGFLRRCIPTTLEGRCQPMNTTTSRLSFAAPVGGGRYGRQPEAPSARERIPPQRQTDERCLQAIGTAYWNPEDHPRRAVAVPASAIARCRAVWAVEGRPIPVRRSARGATRTGLAEDGSRSQAAAPF